MAFNCPAISSLAASRWRVLHGLALVHSTLDGSGKSNAAFRGPGQHAGPGRGSCFPVARFAANRHGTCTLGQLLRGHHGVAGQADGIASVPGMPARVSLVDANGQPLVQSDAPAAGNGSGLIDVSVPAGENFIEVQSLGSRGTYRITADFVASDPAFQTVQTDFVFPAMAEGNFFGPGARTDLVTPDGIYVGNGDGTFQSTPVDGPLGQPGWYVSAIAVGNFASNNLPDIAYTEISPDFMSAQLCVLLNEGNGQFVPGLSFGVDSYPVAIQTIAYGNGVTDLAVADGITGNVGIFVGDGQGGFSAGFELPGGAAAH